MDKLAIAETIASVILRYGINCYRQEFTNWWGILGSGRFTPITHPTSHLEWL